MNTDILKSVGDKKCLTKCYPKQIPFIHPVTLEITKGRNTDVCAVNPEYQYKTSLSKNNAKYQRLIYDQCNLDDNTKKILPNVIESLLLQNTFDTLEFLNKIYEIYSFDEIIKWTVNNDHLPRNTVKRIHNCGWQVFANTEANKTKYLTMRVYHYYYDMFKSRWIKDCIRNIEKNYSFIISLDKNITLENIILTKYINLENTVEWINKFIKHHTKNWYNVINYYDRIRQSCIDSVIDKVKHDYQKIDNDVKVKLKTK